MPLAAIRAQHDEEDGGRDLPLLQYLRAIDIIKKGHFSFRLLWSFIVQRDPGPLFN
jgi:hypothetical protein